MSNPCDEAFPTVGLFNEFDFDPRNFWNIRNLEDNWVDQLNANMDVLLHRHLCFMIASRISFFTAEENVYTKCQSFPLNKMDKVETKLPLVQKSDWWIWSGVWCHSSLYTRWAGICLTYLWQKFLKTKVFLDIIIGFKCASFIVLGVWILYCMWLWGMFSLLRIKDNQSECSAVFSSWYVNSVTPCLLIFCVLM